MRKIQYYAYARHNGKIEQMLVTRIKIEENKPTIPHSLVWTGKIYKDEKEADKDMIRLNCGGK